MESKKIKHVRHSEDFILKVLRDYYSSGKSKYFISKTYGISECNLIRWLKRYDFEGKELSLSSEIINKVKTMRKRQGKEKVPKNRKQSLSSR